MKLMVKMCLLILLISFITTNIWAGEKGKISGKIIDSQTGEPLIGANIILLSRWQDGREFRLETIMGGSTDFEGDYFIINIPPGMYSLKASYVGYADKVLTNVQVNVDRTTIVDFELTAEDLVTDEVLVTAYSPQTVEKDLTATKQTYNIDEVQSLAGVADIADILELQADVVDDHFRGGRVGESLYLMGGGSIVNPLNNQRAFKPIVTGLEQVEVYTSGFSAEYGNAQSGVVNMVTKEGGDRWETRVEFAANPPYYKSWAGSPYSTSNLDFYNGLTDPVSWLDENPTQPGKPLYDAGYGFGPRYLPPRVTWPPDPLTQNDSLHIARLGQVLWLQSVRDVGMEYDNTVDHRLDFTIGGPITKKLKMFVAGRQNIENPIVPTPDDDIERQLLTSFSYQLDNSNKLKFRFVYDNVFENGLSSNWERWLFDRTFYVSKLNNTSLQFGLSWNYIQSRSTFADIKLNVLKVQTEERIELLEEGEFLEDYSQGTNWVDYTGPSNHRVGRLVDDRGVENVITYDLSASVTSQVDKGNLLKAGLQFSYYDLNVDQQENVTNPGSFRAIQFSAFPYEGAFFVQDKMEFEGFIANIGIRFDFYDFNYNFFSDIYSPLRNPNYDDSKPYLERGQYYNPNEAQKEKTKLFSRIQPRVGLSFPLSETSVFHLNYGTFTQRPSFNQIFYNQVTIFNEIEELGNPRLKPENTKAYDIGLVNAFPFGVKLDVSAYYKDVTNLVESAYYYDEQQTVYQTYINRDYADIKGFHISLEKSEGSVRGYLRYNYESATGKSSNALDAPVTYFEQPAEGQDASELPDPEDVFLNYDRSHKAVANIRYLTPSEFLFGIDDFYPFGSINVSLTYKAYTGRPYTYDETGQGLKFNKRTPVEQDLRMRIEKRIRMANTDLIIYGEGFNLLNKEIYNYSRTFDDERNTPRWENDRENILTDDEYFPYVTSQELYLLSNQPRHFRFGVIVKF
ncbi:MAG: TonB-dependent receptor [Melioribacteraceae bacterium]|nr:TonB-dependent receptor [Melioribacteraceae bacterium]